MVSSGASRPFLVVAIAIFSILILAAIIQATKIAPPVEGLVGKIDRAERTVLVRAANRTCKSFQFAEHAANDVGKDTERAAQKSVYVIARRSEEEEHKVAHFFAAG